MVTCGEGADKERSHNRIASSGIARLERKSQEASTHELARSRDLVRSPDCKEEIPWRVCCGYGFPDREIEEP
jgi:hypothetical protein